MIDKLTPKQSVFIEEYLIDLNATQAAIRAGYSEKTARKIGSENLTKPDIQEAIQVAMDERSKRTKITADSVLEEIAKLGFANMFDYIQVGSGGLASIDLSNLTRDQAAAITEITIDSRKEFIGQDEDPEIVEKVRFKLADKGANLERLGKHLKLFTDKVEHSGEIGLSALTDEQLDARIIALQSE